MVEKRTRKWIMDHMLWQYSKCVWWWSSCCNNFPCKTW
jgi:hypothetical protein